MNAVAEKQDLIVVEDRPGTARALAPSVAQDASSLMKIIDRAAMDPSFDVAKLQELLKVKREWDADEARKAFNVAFANFKSEAVKIVKRTEVKDGPLKGKFHANLFDVVDATTPHLSKHGLTISWKLTKDEPAWMEVTCTLRHASGHSESVSMGGAPDTGPGRNAIQARGSAKSYLERYTATSILGLAAQDADNDGNGGGKKLMTEVAYQEFVKKIEAATSKDKAKEEWRTALAECERLGDKDSATAIKEVLKKHLAFIDSAAKAA